ncbi:serine hydrolase domain-containing protein [Aquimarina sediminis]|uniref:serine hydrolase domain-containing protein n=1 Tax=Aquimarina sediminis TaxID=2070536 RepID=UPI0019D493B5|nr:serine hydrolase [Aquimarina sediminis]
MQRFLLFTFSIFSLFFGNAQINFDKTNSHQIPLLQKMDSLILSGKYERITSVLVSHNGNVIFENYYNGKNVNSMHNTRSATKTITGTLIGTLIDDKLLPSEDSNAITFFDKSAIQNYDKRKESITIEDLLTMSSILECNDGNQFSRGNEERMYLVESWDKFYWDLPIKGYPDWIKKPEDSKYGRSFSYCTSGTVVLGSIINQASKTSLADYAYKRLFSQLGIEKRNYKWQYTPTGIPMTGGGLQLRSRDLLKIAQLYLNKGNWNNRQLLSSEWVLKSMSPKVSINDNTEYGYLWWIKEFHKEKSYYMSGNGGNKAMVFPGLDLTVVVTTVNYNNRNAHNYTDEVLGKFIVPAVKKLKKQ